MQQLKLDLETFEDIYSEFENEHHIKIVSYRMKEDLFRGNLDYNLNKEQLKDWFCVNLFDFDLEVSCEELFDIARGNGIIIS